MLSQKVGYLYIDFAHIYLFVFSPNVYPTYSFKRKRAFNSHIPLVITLWPAKFENSSNVGVILRYFYASNISALRIITCKTPRNDTGRVYTAFK